MFDKFSFDVQLQSVKNGIFKKQKRMSIDIYIFFLLLLFKCHLNVTCLIVRARWCVFLCLSLCKLLHVKCQKRVKALSKIHTDWMNGIDRRIILYCIEGITVYYIFIHFIFHFPPANVLVEREKACGSWLCGGNSPVSTGRHRGNPVHTFCEARSARAGSTGSSRWHRQPRWKATGWGR